VPLNLARRMRRWATNSDTVRQWRERRYQLFMELCSVSPQDRILDVGAGRGLGLERFNATNPIVAVDLKPKAEGWLAGPNVTVVAADGTNLPFGDREFDVSFSNSVVEHIPRGRQQAFADEIRRVSERYFVQTPNRYFPIEPHYQLPLFQFLPRRAQLAVNRRVTLGWRKRGANTGRAEINLLSASDLSRLFPDAEIHRERLFGLTKSLMAVGRRASGMSRG
jgi:2-polyprenyl-3-methyl-5-hydroxy-6-metoxy-1,4-benzoquinol methylase